jgi:signal peptidase I
MGKRLSRLFWILAAALLLRACAFESVRMTDDSMQPLLRDGDVVFVSKLRYGLRVPGAGAVMLEWSEPKKGDLVVAVSIGDPPVNLLRRITAVAGEKVTGPDGKEVTLKEGEYFLAAEQKDGMDSRKLGPVNRKAIIGKATYVWVAKRPSTEGGNQVESPEQSATSAEGASSTKWRVLQPL